MKQAQRNFSPTIFDTAARKNWELFFDYTAREAEAMHVVVERSKYAVHATASWLCGLR